MQFANFVTVAFHQLATVVSKRFYLSNGFYKVPIVVRMPYGVNLSGAGFMMGAGPHHSQSPEVWFCNLAGVKVVMPSTPQDALGLLKSAIRDDNPVMFLEQKGMYHSQRAVLPYGEHLILLAQADLKRPGRDVTVVATGAIIHQAPAVAARLGSDGIDVEVVDPRSVVPCDFATIEASVAKTGRVVIAHEAQLTGGFGAEICAYVAQHCFHYLRAPMMRLGALDMPIPAGYDALSVVPSETLLQAAITRTIH